MFRAVFVGGVLGLLVGILLRIDPALLVASTFGSMLAAARVSSWLLSQSPNRVGEPESDSQELSTNGLEGRAQSHYQSIQRIENS
jgi:hypothetical protein